MSDQQTTSEGDHSRDQKLFWALSILLIGSFVWKVSTPAHEYDRQSVVIMEMVFDLGCVVGLLGMIKRRGSNPLLWIALLAGLGLFGIRLSSKAGWSTGHLKYCVQVAYAPPCVPR
jgi:hypothetical protein